ncbi:MAG: phenylacetate--CoA ligase family protein, partial [Proteobacteria bacterium]|nr:phenylacetate--CoA ligase family protein [Pseudomonadota bacterium]
LVSGDLTSWESGPGACGRTYPLLPLGIFGRIDDMFTIRGENIYPSEIDAAINQLPDYGGEHQIVISRESAMDELLLKVEAAPEIYQAGDGALGAFQQATAQKMNQVLGLRARVEIVPHGSLPRTDFKARRVIDDRDVFREMQAEIDRRQTS